MNIENMSIEKATERCKALTNPEQGCWIGISNQKAIGTVLSELEKKDKVINEMAEDLYGLATSINEEYRVEEFLLNKETIKEYFTNKVEREGK